MSKFGNKSYLVSFVLFVIFFSGLFFISSVKAGTLSCSVTTAAACSGGTNTIIYRMSNSTNAHAELPSQSTAVYSNNVICCNGVTGLGNSCTAPSAVVLKLSSTTNAHGEKNTETNYANNACISVPSGGTTTVGYVTDPTTCSEAGFDTTLGTLFSDTNSHVGNATAYSIKICATASGAPIGLPATSTLTSSVFDTTELSTSIGYNSIMWKGSLGTGGTGKVRFQFATAAAPTGPWNFYGGTTCGALDWFDALTPDNPIELKGGSCLPAWNNKRYFRYKVQLCSDDCVTTGTFTPIVENIIVNWSS